MAHAQMNFLSRDEEDFLHGQSVRCLQDLGVLIRSPLVLKMLEDTGALVDHDRLIARIPEDMVNEAVRAAPREFTLCARNPKHDMKVPVEGIPYAGTTGLANYMTDLETEERRDATLSDLADFARLADAIDSVDFFLTVVIPMDVSDRSHASHQLWTSLKNTGKHVQQVEVIDAEDAKVQIELASMLAGGKDELKERPLFSVVSSPVSPMSFEKGAAEAQVELSRAGIPIVSMTMPLSGFTSPVTVAGTMNVINVENLASLVISQTANAGSPFVYSSSGTPGDMRTGSVPSGPAESPSLTAGLGQLARRYGLPYMSGGWGLCNGAKPGVTMSISEVLSYSAETFSSVDLISGLGLLDGAKGASLEQVIIDAYTWENFRPSLRRMEVDDRSIAFDALRDVGQGGTFIAHPHTLRNFREAIFNRNENILRWEATFSRDMVPEARSIVKKLISEHKVVELDSAELEKGESILCRYERG
ncbi:MAG: trimethylamine methyltransferase family protein [Methanobacteriota archaeon]|nr:MAG: trimethylamine methyltransferase family protein [Euryarchaeota archaeon]